jgi:hypothetical protein
LSILSKAARGDATVARSTTFMKPPSILRQWIGKVVRKANEPPRRIGR